MSFLNRFPIARLMPTSFFINNRSIGLADWMGGVGGGHGGGTRHNKSINSRDVELFPRIFTHNVANKLQKDNFIRRRPVAISGPMSTGGGGYPIHRTHTHSHTGTGK